LLEPHADDVSRGVGRKRWKSYIDGVAVSTFTRRPGRQAKRLVKRLADLGYAVALTPLAG
jgi:hypothetical protein